MSSGATNVLDSSALLAFIASEPGGEIVESLLDGAALSAVNWSEVLQKLHSRNVQTDDLKEAVLAKGLSIVAFDAADAETAAKVWASTRTHGLSLGDSACLALARTCNATAVTADRIWATVDVGVEIRLIR